MHLKNHLVEEAVQILHAALMESTSKILKELRFQVIVQAIDNFVENLSK